MSQDPNSPRVLARLPTEIDAVLLVDHLEGSGIKAMIGGAGTSTGWPEAPGDVQVLVRASDLERTLAVRLELSVRLPRLK